MDLKTYAVSQKISTDSNLLDYIVKGQDIPLDVIESSFADFLESFEDSQAHMMVNDYIKYLHTSIPLGIVSLGDHKFKIDGHIPQGVLHALKLLHNVEPETLVQEVINHTFSDLHQDREIKIESLQLLESSKVLVEKIKSQSPVIDTSSTPEVNHQSELSSNNVSDLMTSEVLTPVTTFTLEDESSNEKVANEWNIGSTDVSTELNHNDTNVIPNPIDTISFDDITIGDDPSFDVHKDSQSNQNNDDTLIANPVPLSETITEDVPTSDVNEDDIQKAFVDKLTSIYDDFVSELHRLNIPERLASYGYPIEL